MINIEFDRKSRYVYLPYYLLYFLAIFALIIFPFKSLIFGVPIAQNFLHKDNFWSNLDLKPF
jgi:hypothetical protein